MKYRLNIFSNQKIKNFLINFLSQYDLTFMNLDSIDYKSKNLQANIIVINNNKDANLINFTDLGENYLILSNLKKKTLNINNKLELLKSPISINHIKNSIKKFVQNLKIRFHDLLIDNEKITNLNNNSICYLTKVEQEILSCLIKEKEISKNFIKKNILNIKSNIETNSLESHLSRIRKKMSKIKTAVKIQAKNEKLKIVI